MLIAVARTNNNNPNPAKPGEAKLEEPALLRTVASNFAHRVPAEEDPQKVRPARAQRGVQDQKTKAKGTEIKTRELKKTLDENRRHETMRLAQNQSVQ